MMMAVTVVERCWRGSCAARLGSELCAPTSRRPPPVSNDIIRDRAAVAVEGGD